MNYWIGSQRMMQNKWAKSTTPAIMISQWELFGRHHTHARMTIRIHMHVHRHRHTQMYTCTHILSNAIPLSNTFTIQVWKNIFHPFNQLRIAGSLQNEGTTWEQSARISFPKLFVKLLQNFFQLELFELKCINRIHFANWLILFEPLNSGKLAPRLFRRHRYLPSGNNFSLRQVLINMIKCRCIESINKRYQWRTPLYNWWELAQAF